MAIADDGAYEMAQASAMFDPRILGSLAGIGMLSAQSCSPAAPVEVPPQPSSTSARETPVQSPSVLLAEWQGSHGGVPPWDKVDVELFRPAFDEAVALLLAEIDAITKQSEPPTFDNTLLPLERSGRALDRVATLFFVMTGNMNSPEYQKLSGVIRPLLSEVRDKINFNAALYKRVATVYEKRAAVGLDAEQTRVVELTYEGFVRRGANLDAAKKTRMAAINSRLAELFSTFSNRVQADEDSVVWLETSELEGLSKALIGSYAAAAEKRGKPGHAVVNTRSAMAPFLTFSSNRGLREKVWRAYTQRGDNGDENDTNELIVEIVKLRAERAKLLGFESHAHWRMSDTMAKDPERASQLMMRVWPAAVARVEEEVRDMQALANKERPRVTVEPWDYRYYMEKVRKARYDLDQTEFKKYFELENMIAASYYMAERLYGYAFEEITGTVPTFHPDVRVYRVTVKADGSHVGYFYRDDFARQYKRSGAWQATYQTQHKVDGQVDAIVSNNNNFTKSEEGEPVLISLDDARTLFHEFGHALHALTNNTTYPSLADTPRDFVEFPSQVHENWVLTPEVLDKFARHYKTGEAMPQALIDKMQAASTFNQGFATVEYLSAALVDMALHTDPTGVVEPKAFERETLKKIGMPKQIVLRHRLPQFNHLFSSDSYSAGYYSYLWSDVMATDAWAAFKEAKDPWDPTLAARFTEVILATGNAIDRAEAYKLFRGRDPRIEALLADRGFPATAPKK